MKPRRRFQPEQLEKGVQENFLYTSEIKLLIARPTLAASAGLTRISVTGILNASTRLLIWLDSDMQHSVKPGQIREGRCKH